MTIFNNSRITLFIIFILCMLFFAKDLSIHGIEYRDDEIFYFNSAKEMLQTDNLLSPIYFGGDRFQKPILFYWMVIFMYKIFGVNWFSARLTSVITASLTVVLTFILAMKLFNRRVAIISSIILATLPMFFRHAKNVVPDMTLNFFIVLSIMCGFLFTNNTKERKYSYLFFISCGLGFMTKGFAAIIIPIVTFVTYTVLSNKRHALKDINFPMGLAILLIIVLPWFIYMTLIHGRQYIDYMLGVETLNRAVAPGEGNIFVKIVLALKSNSLFYIKTIMSYFAPWSVFIIGALPLAFSNIRQDSKERLSLLLMLVWFFVTFIFFSLIAHRINHLILVLTTPFSILVAYFFLEAFNPGLRIDILALWFRKIAALIILVAGLVGLSFVKVFLLGSNVIWLYGFLTILLLGAVIIMKYKDPIAVPLTVGCLLLFSFSQSALLSQARFTPVSTMQEFAKTVKSNGKTTDAIGVGSHNIHEKEFQIYFDKKIEKIATSNYHETKKRLDDFFANNKDAYCLMTRRDYDRMIKPYFNANVRILQKDYMFRRHIKVDKGLFDALFKLDRPVIRNYFLEDVVLIKKESHG